MNITEAAIISSGLALVRIQNLKFISDIGDIIKHNITEAGPMDLIFLTKGAFYMRDFKHTKDVYATVHARAISLLNMQQLEPAHVQALTALFNAHGIIADSPFVTVRVER
uniref:Uncharacterized protein n=1 Tax=Favella ehrenbergii TaxID=182087 RepID=A0A7S3MRF7_9SPIT|mmetsp:Transcript_9465/g.11613  ORF Transcript_9465/g.11613 Transcript_9465/m.11613 type:complete len:110 (+) Transcript_9465:1559-1888(+)